jgi:hypothetical protein
MMPRSVSSWSVVRPRPVPRETHALKRLAVTTVALWDCASALLEGPSAAAPAAASPVFNSVRRDGAARFLSI